MVVSVQILGVDNVEMAPSLVVSTETERLLFNVGDGTQRLCMEHHIRLAKLRQVFLTELRPWAVGGLPGMVLTVSDAGRGGLGVHGPEGTRAYIHATRHFLHRPEFELLAQDHPLAAPSATGQSAAAPCYIGDEVRVHAIPVRCARAGAKRKLHEATSTANPSPSPGTAANDCVSYVVEIPEQRGKFLVDRAVALGVPKGALFGRLHKGEDVTLPDGRVVRSADCVSPSTPASGCAFITCPSLGFIDGLVSATGFARYQWRDANSDASNPEGAPEVQLQVLYHLGDPSVLQEPTYVAWIRRFGSDVEHVVLSDRQQCPRKTVYRASAKLQAELHSVFPHAFPANDYELADAETPFSRRLELPFTAKPVIVGESMLRYTLSPMARRGFDGVSCFERLNYDEIRASTAGFRATATTPTGASFDSTLNGRITFLGTGCAIPSKYRNVTCNYLELPAEGDVTHGVLLDCGEGSLGQLVRYANGDLVRLRALVQGIKLIWISHNHADHHLGILRLLSYRTMSEDDEPVVIIGPTPVEWWLKEYAKLDPTVAGKYTFVDNYCFDDTDERFQEATTTARPTRAWLQETIAITDFECVQVKHAFRAYAVVFTWKNKLKIAFSGDCRPSAELAARARDAFLFIHEATFEDTMETEAKQKNHSTTAEALDVGKKARAKHVVLTHFSQRYPKMPAMDSSASDENDAMSAMDLLSLRFSDLHTQSQLMETCMQILAMDDIETEDNESA